MKSGGTDVVLGSRKEGPRHWRQQKREGTTHARPCSKIEKDCFSIQISRKKGKAEREGKDAPLCHALSRVVASTCDTGPLETVFQLDGVPEGV